MKLRIQGSSLRFRLTQKEVNALHAEGRVQSEVQFCENQLLHYSVISSPSAVSVTADFHGNSIRTTLPAATVAAWAGSEEVSIERKGCEGLHILIEKDFRCLHKPVAEEPDAYPNPHQNC